MIPRRIPQVRNIARTACAPVTHSRDAVTSVSPRSKNTTCTVIEDMAIPYIFSLPSIVVLSPSPCEQACSNTPDRVCGACQTDCRSASGVETAIKITPLEDWSLGRIHQLMALLTPPHVDRSAQLWDYVLDGTEIDL